MKKICFLALAFFIISQSIIAQEDTARFRFDLSVRYRFESWNGMNAKNYGDDRVDAIGKLDDKILLQRIIPGITFSRKK